MYSWPGIGAKFDSTGRNHENRECPSESGPVAQLGARFHGMEEVTGSIPVRSTSNPIHSYGLTSSRPRSNGCAGARSRSTANITLLYNWPAMPAPTVKVIGVL